MKERLILLLKLSVAAGLIVWLVQSGRLDLTSLAQVADRWPWLVAALLVFGVVLWLGAMRWHTLLRAQEIDCSFREVYSMHMISWFFNQVMLGTLGGDVVKAYMVGRDHRERQGKAIISVFVDRFVGLAVLLAIAFAAMVFFFLTSREALQEPVGQNLRFLAWVLGALLLSMTVVSACYFSKRIRSMRWVRRGLSWAPLARFVDKISASIAGYREKPGAVLSALGLSVGIHVGVIVTVILLASAYYGEPPLWKSFFFVVPVSNALMAIPLNPPAALGTGELIYAELFSWVGFAGGALICLSQRFCQLAWGLVGLVFYVRRKGRVKEALREAQELTPP